MTRPEWDNTASGGSDSLERACLKISELTGGQRRGLGLWILILTMATGFWTPAMRRPLAFFLLVSGIAWFQMLLTGNAGTGAHHTATLWPALLGFVSIGLGKLSVARRLTAKLVYVIVSAAVALNVLVVNEHLADWIRYGPTAVWTDAVFSLARAVRTAKTERLVLVDWGIAEALTLLLEGKTPTQHAIRPYERKEWDPEEHARASHLLQRSDLVYVGRTEGNRIFPELSQLLEGLAFEQGYNRQILRVIRDRHARPMFEIYRFVRH